MWVLVPPHPDSPPPPLAPSRLRTQGEAARRKLAAAAAQEASDLARTKARLAEAARRAAQAALEAALDSSRLDEARREAEEAAELVARLGEERAALQALLAAKEAEWIRATVAASCKACCLQGMQARLAAAEAEAKRAAELADAMAAEAAELEAAAQRAAADLLASPSGQARRDARSARSCTAARRSRVSSSSGLSRDTGAEAELSAPGPSLFLLLLAPPPPPPHPPPVRLVLQAAAALERAKALEAEANARATAAAARAPRAALPSAANGGGDAPGGADVRPKKVVKRKAVVCHRCWTLENRDRHDYSARGRTDWTLEQIWQQVGAAAAWRARARAGFWGEAPRAPPHGQLMKGF